MNFREKEKVDLIIKLVYLLVALLVFGNVSLLFWNLSPPAVAFPIKLFFTGSMTFIVEAIIAIPFLHLRLKLWEH